MSPELRAAAELGEAMVTAVLHGEPDTAAGLLAEAEHPHLVSLMLANLAAHIHREWTYGVECDPPADDERMFEVWSMICLDLVNHRGDPQ